MLFAPPAHSHEERLIRTRVCSPPITTPSPNRIVSHSPPKAGRSPPNTSKEFPKSPQTRMQMSNINEFSPSNTSSGHTPPLRRSPQTTPNSSSSLVGTSSSTAVSTLGGSLSGSNIPSGTVGGGSTPPIHHPLLGYVPHGSKILSRNFNGTLAVTSQPSNESELQLYRVLQRANLLTYYDTFISQGGDDVQQLCEAGEEEFLEIMALVGMASKPLHVRRLQKALQEWVSNPSVFQIPLLPNLPASVVAGFPTFPSRGMIGGSPSTPSNRPSPPVSSIVPNSVSSPGISKDSHTTISNSIGINNSRDVMHSSATQSVRDGFSSLGSRVSSPSIPSTIHLNSTSHPPPSLQNCQSTMLSEKSHELLLQFMKNTGPESPGLSYPPSSGSPVGGSPGSNSPQGVTPSLNEAQIARIAQTASEHVANLPPLEARKDPLNKRKVSKELEMIMNMNEDDPRRMEELRKYAAIYGRFDCKRKPEKPLTLHEVSVNEAAAQICKYMPALLTRRDELFPLARLVVRDSGYQYSKGHSRSQSIVGREDEPRHKRSRLDSGPDSIEKDPHFRKRQERLESISEELRAMSDKAEEVRNSLTSGTGNLSDLTQQMDALHARHAQLTIEQTELMKAHHKSLLQRHPRGDRCCNDDGKEDSDSQYSYSANSSPSQVISSSQGNIIAVANPALSMSSTIPPTHSLHDEIHHQPLYPGSNKQAIKQEPSSPERLKQE